VKQSYFYDPACLHIRRWLNISLDHLTNDQLHDVKLIPKSYYRDGELVKPCVELLHYQSLENVKNIAIKVKKKNLKHGAVPGLKVDNFTK
jgi:hypothetical protein